MPVSSRELPVAPASLAHLSPFCTHLRDGQPVALREVTPKDRHLLEIGFDHLSPTSRYFRFHAPHKALSGKELDTFTALNDTEHMAIGAQLDNAPNPTPLGIARYVKDPNDPASAEFAITIVDTHHRLGLGSLLLGVLAKLAAVNSVKTFTGLVHADNKAMLAMVETSGGYLSNSVDSEIQVTLPVFQDPRLYPASHVGDQFRAAYGLAKIKA